MKVLVTGAAGGLGRAYVNECVRRGWNVCGVDVNAAGLAGIREGVRFRTGRAILVFPCDLTDDGDVGRLMEFLHENAFEPDMLLNVAGLDYEGGFLDRRFQELRRIVDVNILGTMRVTHRIVSARTAETPFYMIFVSSLAAGQPMPLKATYAASKRFLLDFARAIGEELRDRNVHVLAVCPGGMTTHAEVTRAIDAQGFFGTVTTCAIERVVARSLDRSLGGRSVYVPGAFNRFTAFLNRWIPVSLTTRLLYRRWSKTQRKWLYPNR